MQNNLKQCRINLGLTQNDIAFKSGISSITYQRYEYGKRLPDVGTALKIAKILNSTVEQLFYSL